MNELLNVHEFLAAAAAKVDPAVWCYFEGGAEDEVTLRENLAAFSRWQLRPRMLVDVGEIGLETTLLGTTVAMPLGIAPFALQRLLDLGVDRRIDLRPRDIGARRVGQRVIERALVLHSHSSAPIFHA